VGTEAVAFKGTCAQPADASRRVMLGLAYESSLASGEKNNAATNTTG
jgi:hypothetical protein